MSSFTLKIIAFISMIADHTAAVFELNYSFRCVGRIAFPLFAYMISEGCKYTKNFKLYLIRLFVCAIASEAIYDIIFNDSINFFFDLNIVFTLFLACLSICLFEYINKKFNLFLGLWLVLFFADIAQVFSFDYGFLGVILIFSLYISKNKSTQLFVLAVFAIIKYYKVIFGALSKYFDIYFLSDFQNYFFPKNFWYFIFTLIPILFVSLYNGKRGFNIKYLFYVLYPLHIFVLFILKNIILF